MLTDVPSDIKRDYSKGFLLQARIAANTGTLQQVQAGSTVF
jgi:hypothetical protein